MRKLIIQLNTKLYEKKPSHNRLKHYSKLPEKLKQYNNNLVTFRIYLKKGLIGQCFHNLEEFNRGKIC